MKSLQISTFGKPAAVVELVERDAPRPEAGQVLVAMEAAPINPSDLLLMRGRYGHRPRLPAELGAEGIGRIIDVGAAVAPTRVGERVLIVPALRHGTWQDQVAVEADDALPVDPDVDALQMAMLGINPMTADLLLRSFVDLPPGAWVAQTGGSSAVGSYVVALARQAGLRSLSLVRRPEAVPALLAAGADAVVVSGPQFADDVADALGDDRISLLIDGVAGDAVTDFVPWLAQGSTLVSYGGMSGGPVAMSPADLIFRDIRVRGFWQMHWLERTPREEVAAAYARLGALVGDGVLKAPVTATYTLDQSQAALAHAAETGRAGKVLFAW